MSDTRAAQRIARPNRPLSACVSQIAALALGVLGSAQAGAPELRTVDTLDLTRYAGKWFEIARLPNSFQRQCVADTTATYTLRADGKVTVLNECRRADGAISRITGVAVRARSSATGGKLRVSFFWPFYGNYWVIDLDPEYRWAVVGEPARRYLWILSRTSKLDEGTLKRIFARARAQGYELASVTTDLQQG